MSAQNSIGIQTLLDAEREASKIVQQAREFRTQRLKAARDGAKDEIEAFRTSKEDSFKKFEAEHTTGNQAAEDEANKEADAKLRDIKELGKQNEARVINDLLRAVFEVKPVAPSQI